MTDQEAKAEAEKIVQKHFKIIESYLIFHGMTEMEMKIMAEKHAAQEVRGIIEVCAKFVVVSTKTRPIDLLDTKETIFWTSVLTEIEKTK